MFLFESLAEGLYRLNADGTAASALPGLFFKVTSMEYGHLSKDIQTSGAEFSIRT